MISILQPHHDVKPAFTTFPSLNRFIVFYEEPPAAFTYYQRFPVTGEIEKKEGLSPSVLKVKDLHFGFVEGRGISFTSI
jgi:hypothetical protein